MGFPRASHWSASSKNIALGSICLVYKLDVFQINVVVLVYVVTVIVKLSTRKEENACLLM